MGNPCGGKSSRICNQYIELYNNDLRPVDVYGWYLFTTSQIYVPQRIVSWNQRNPKIKVGEAITDSTIIPPGGYAVILSPFYYGQRGDPPYHFPANTLILTVEKGTRLGSQNTGIISWDPPLTSIYIYKGIWNRVDQVISTYGIAGVDATPQRYQLVDRLPLLAPSECTSVQRKHAYSPDQFESWEVTESSPGTGPYASESADNP